MSVARVDQEAAPAAPEKRCPKCDEPGHDGRRHGWDRRERPAPAPPPAERVRAKTINNDRIGITKWNKLNGVDGRAARHHLPVVDDYPEDVDRPLTRGDCSNMPRPCPFVSCSHHLALDVNPSTGSLKLNFPHLEVWEMPETCSLDVADKGGVTLEEVGAILNLTRERIRQVEVRGLAKIKDHTGNELGLPPERRDSAGQGWTWRTKGAP